MQKYLDGLKRADNGLRSIWLYSWPDARSLIPVAHAGGHVNPLPLGYWIISDSDTVGEIVLGSCSCIDRPGRKLLACPIVTENDAWGVVVFEHETGSERLPGYKNIYAAFAHKLSHIIYNHD